MFIRGRHLPLKSLCWLILFLLAGGEVNAQGPCGGKPCPVIRVAVPRKRIPSSVPRQKPSRVDPERTEPAPRPLCEDSDFVVVCGMPGCEITLNSKQSNRAKFQQLSKTTTDDLGGFTFQVLGNQFYKVSVSKPGYELFESEIRKVACDDQQEMKTSLKAKPVTLRIRTDPVECDIYLEGSREPNGRSDNKGLYSYLLNKPTLLIEARKKGYLSDTQTVLLAPEWASREITLSLEPISASVHLKSNVEVARVTVDDKGPSKSVADRVLVAPGQHTITVEALGYKPEKLQLSVGPEEIVAKEITLERLSLPALQAMALSRFSSRAYDDVLKLTQFMFEADSVNASAHRLVGLVLLERGDFATAQAHFEKALSGGESFSLRLRRHAGEKFELSKGHDACDAQIVLSKSDLEFSSTRNPIENFKVSYDQVQVIGLQLKSRVATYLSTKVNVGGRKRDYNFYSFDRELSQSGRAYLEMVQRLLRSH